MLVNIVKVSEEVPACVGRLVYAAYGYPDIPWNLEVIPMTQTGK